jgi:hypothetical protein
MGAIWLRVHVGGNLGLPSIEDGKPMITWRATSLAPDGLAWH